MTLWQNMMKAVFAILAGLLGMTGAAELARADRQVVTKGDFKLSVADDFVCASMVTVRVDAVRAEQYRTRLNDLERLIGGARAVLGFECDKIQGIMVQGYSADSATPVYMGSSAQMQNWKLTQLAYNAPASPQKTSKTPPAVSQQAKASKDVSQEATGGAVMEPGASGGALRLIGEIANSRGQINSLYLMNGDRQMMPSRPGDHRALLEPQRNFALLYLQGFPEVLEQDGNVMSFAQILFTKEVREFNMSRPTPFDRKRKTEEFRDRLKNLPGKPVRDLKLFLRTSLGGNYDFKTGKLPSVKLDWEYKLSLPTRVQGFNCVDLDREFHLDGLSMPEQEAEAFLERNKTPNNRKYMFFSVSLSIFEKTKHSVTDSRSCPFVARLNSVGAHEFRAGKEPRAEQEARVGGQFRQWTLDNPGEAEIKLALKYRAPEADAPEVARKHKLATRKGYILAGAGGSRGRILEQDEQAALNQFMEYMALGMHLDWTAQPHVTQCYAQKYLSPAEREDYFEGKNNYAGQFRGNWKGANEFERERTVQRYLAGPGKLLQQKAVSLPQKFILIHPLSFSKQHKFYHEDKGGVTLPGRSAMTLSTPKICDGMVWSALVYPDAVPQYWKIGQAALEKILPRLSGDQNHYMAYQATVVELVPVPSAAFKRIGPDGVAPVMVRVQSSAVYGDIDLKDKVADLPLFRAETPALSVGLDAARAEDDGRAFPEESGYQRAMRVLKDNPDGLGQDAWAFLSQEQARQDDVYYKNLKMKALDQTQNLVEMPKGYRPFYPDVRHYPVYADFTPEQIKLFREWTVKRAAAIPAGLSLQGRLSWDKPKDLMAISFTATKNYGFRELEKVLETRGYDRERIILPQVQDVQNRSSLYLAPTGMRVVAYVLPQAQSSLISELSVDRLVGLFENDRSRTTVRGEFAVGRTESLPLDNGGEAFLIHLKPRRLEVEKYSSEKRAFEAVYEINLR